MSAPKATFRILLSKAYEVAVWAAFAGLTLHAVLTNGPQGRSVENREATSTVSDAVESIDLNAPARH